MDGAENYLHIRRRTFHITDLHSRRLPEAKGVGQMWSRAISPRPKVRRRRTAAAMLC